MTDGRVVAIKPRLCGRGELEIDAGGKWVMPGMIDMVRHVAG